MRTTVGELRRLVGEVVNEMITIDPEDDRGWDRYEPRRAEFPFKQSETVVARRRDDTASVWLPIDGKYRLQFNKYRGGDRVYMSMADRKPYDTAEAAIKAADWALKTDDDWAREEEERKAWVKRRQAEEDDVSWSTKGGRR